MHISSPAFENGQTIPILHTCDGNNISPALDWQFAPPGTESFALIMEDPDASAGTWIHWVIYNIPAASSGLPQGVPPQDQLTDGSLHGLNSWQRIGYSGPCPPGGTHRYIFNLYAVDRMLSLNAGLSSADVREAIQTHLLTEAELIGVYQRVK